MEKQAVIRTHLELPSALVLHGNIDGRMRAGKRSSLVEGLLLILLICQAADAFYLPGVAPQDFAKVHNCLGFQTRALVVGYILSEL